MLTGTADERKAMAWLDGSNDIPAHVDLLTLTWMAFPGALGKAIEWAAHISKIIDKDTIVIEEQK